MMTDNAKCSTIAVARVLAGSSSLSFLSLIETQEAISRSKTNRPLPSIILEMAIVVMPYIVG